jgi:arylsulfatase
MKGISKVIASAGLALTAMPMIAQQRPNIIFIYADDLGYSDLSCYGSPLNQTPNLDRMASEGMRFTDFYASAPVSTPSRAGLMTGRYACRLGIKHVFMPIVIRG